MIAILNNADFSENNIGRINIPIELSQWTLDVISKFPSYSWTLEKKSAVEFFYRSLVINGILDRMEYLALPVLCGTTIADAVQNLKEGGVSISSMGNTDIYETIVGKGLARSGATTGAPASRNSLISIDNPRVGFMSEFHFAFCTTDAVPTNGTVYTTPKAKGLESDDILNLDSLTFGFHNPVRMWCLRSMFNKSDISLNEFLDLRPSMFPGINPSQAAPLDVLRGDKNFANIPTTFVACASNNVISMSCGEQAVQTEALIPTDTTKNTQIAFRTDYADAEVATNKRVYFNFQPLVIDDTWFGQHYGILSFGRSLTSEQNIKLQKSMSELLNVLNA